MYEKSIEIKFIKEIVKGLWLLYKLMGYAWFNSTCYHPPPGHTPGKTQPVWPGGREFPQAVLPGGRGAGQIIITTRARTYGVTQWRLLEPRGNRFSDFVNLQSES